MRILPIILIGLWVMAFITTAPDAADIQVCVDTTNYTAERCQFEMTR